MKVCSAGASSSRSSRGVARTRTRSRRSAGRCRRRSPCATRLVGVGFTPRNAVRSADGGGRQQDERRQRAQRSRVAAMPQDHVSVAGRSEARAAIPERPSARVIHSQRWTSGRPRSRSSCAAPCASSPRPRSGPHVMEWDEAQAFPDRPAAEARGARADGHSVRRRVRRRRDVGRRLLHLHRGAGARRSVDRAVGRGAQRPVHARTSAMFGSDAQKQQYLPPLVKGEVLGAWGADRSRAPAATPPRMRTTARREGDGWVLNGSKTVHHARRDRRRDGRDGGDRSREGPPRHLGVRGRARHAGHERRARRKTSSACARATRAR